MRIKISSLKYGRDVGIFADYEVDGYLSGTVLVHHPNKNDRDDIARLVKRHVYRALGKRDGFLRYVTREFASFSNREAFSDYIKGLEKGKMSSISCRSQALIDLDNDIICSIELVDSDKEVASMKKAFDLHREHEQIFYRKMMDHGKELVGYNFNN